MPAEWWSKHLQQSNGYVGFAEEQQAGHESSLSEEIRRLLEDDYLLTTYQTHGHASKPNSSVISSAMSGSGSTSLRDGLHRRTKQLSFYSTSSHPVSIVCSNR
jgi:hypothetical protein